MERGNSLRFVPVALLAITAIAAQDPGEALYRVGRQLLAEGKIESALKKFDEGIAAAPQGPFADDALLAAATIDYPATALGDLGRVPAERIERARPRLIKITTDYRGSDSAPAATYRLGLVRMDPSNPHADLDEAFATFLQVARLYPQAPEAAESMYAAGECHRLQGSLAASAGDDAIVVLEHGSSAAEPRSRLRLAETSAILGETTLARLLLAPLTGREVPASASGAKALSRRASALDALVVRSESDRPDAPGTRQFDVAVPPSANALKVGAIAADAEGDLWILDDSTGKVMKAAGGTGALEVLTSPAAEDARGIVLSHGGGPYLWEDRAVVFPDGRRFEPLGSADEEEEAEPLKRIAGLAPGPLGAIDVLDAGGNRVLRYGRDGALKRVVATLEARPAALASWAGTLLVLVPTRREIVIVPPGGSPAIRSIPLRGAGWSVESPVAITTDSLGRIYVLDDSLGTVHVLDREGKRVASIAPAKGSPGEFRSPTALAVDGAGMVYVADKRQARVLRFR